MRIDALVDVGALTSARLRSCRCLGAAAFWLAGALAMPAVAAPPPAPASPAPVPAPDALKTAFEALPDADRRAVQDALIWVADYTNAVSGNYGPKTREALTAYGKQVGLSPVAVLDAAPRGRLLAAGKAAAEAIGFGPVRDKRAGLVLSLPQKILTKTTAADTGTRYASGDGAITVDTLSRPAGTGGLSELFDRMSASSATRNVTYKFSKSDFFVVTGEIGERKFYSRFALQPGDDDQPAADRSIRGFTLTYPKSDAKRMDRITIAAAASFDPFPAASAQPANGKPAKIPAAGLSAQAVMVAPGLALTWLGPQTCAGPQVNGAAVSFKASDPASGLALLAVPMLSTPAPTLAEGDEAREPYFALFKQSDGLAVAPAVLRETAGGPVVSAALQQIVGGAVVIARSGQVVGMLRQDAASPKLVAGTVPATDYLMTGSGQIRAFLSRSGVDVDVSASSIPATLGNAVAPFASSLMMVTCQTQAAAGSQPPPNTR